MTCPFVQTICATASLLSFRPLQRSDFALLRRWLAEPHVDAWWHDPLDLGAIEQKYGPRIAIVVDPDEHNKRSLRVFEKVGFTLVRTVKLEGENVWRRVMRLSLPEFMSKPIGVG